MFQVVKINKILKSKNLYKKFKRTMQRIFKSIKLYKSKNYKETLIFFRFQKGSIVCQMENIIYINQKEKNQFKLNKNLKNRMLEQLVKNQHCNQGNNHLNRVKVLDHHKKANNN